MDHGGCGLLATVRDGRVVSVKGDPESPVSLGYICAKGLASIERLYHPDRLNTPLVRTGKRGEGKWRDVDWDEALALLAEKMLEAAEKHGPDSVLFAQGAPKGPEFFLMLRLANAFGGPNVVGPQNVCHMPRELTSALTFGFWPEVDFDHPPSVIILWGSNLEHTNEEGVIGSRLHSAIRNGSRIIVVDPKPTRLARKADVWLRLRPGTDAALAMGMMRAILDLGLENRDFIDRNTDGFDALKERLADYPLSKVEEWTWVSKEDIVRAAKLYAGSPPSAVQLGNALEHTTSSHQSCRAVLCLMAMTGNLNVRGGNYKAGTPPSMPLRDFVRPDWISGRYKKMLNARYGLHPRLATVPPPIAVNRILEEDRPVKVLYTQGTNPLQSYPDSRRALLAFQRIDFIAVADIFMTPSAQMADVVLPVSTNFEFDDIGHYGLPHGMLLARPKLVEPLFDTRPDIRILNELGRRLGLGDCFWDDERAMLNDLIAPSGLDLDTFYQRGVLKAKEGFTEDGNVRFKTKSGKAEFYCKGLEEHGLDPLPGFDSEQNGALSTDAEFPYILTSAKERHFFHSAYRHIDLLRKLSPEPRACIAPETAESLHIADGETIRIRTRKGQIRQKVKILDGLDPRVVYAAYGWWFPEITEDNERSWMASNINVLTDGEGAYDPMMGSVNLRAIPCRIGKAEKPPESES